ncbi:Trypsin [Shewanella psychrophila]|uniref:Trypsin n=1 Tax=Shewanella psychrophila TaxID=225848 RepID=A0A1S6HV52_9GAMM|nr:trypsin-like serine protease [Shewanella psychrophila]AQS39440.1 Trypsin [Shewanella psychrophila]
MRKTNIGLPSLALFSALSGIYSSQSLAVEGNDVAANDAPFMVYLKDAHCSGTIIAPKTVLTASHCVSQVTVGSYVYLLHSRGVDFSHNGVRVKVVKDYTATHIYRINGEFDRSKFDDIAILELENMPEGVTWLPVAANPIPLEAEVYPIGYSTSNLKRMPIPARVAAKAHSPDYEREAFMRFCPDSIYFSREYFTQEYPFSSVSNCSWRETSHEKFVESGTYIPNQHSITIENPPLDPSDTRWSMNELGTVETKYSTFRGDSGGPLIFEGKIYGVASSGTDSYSQIHNVATYYAGFTRPGIIKWIVDTVKDIQSRSDVPAMSHSLDPEQRAIIFPDY